MPHYVSIENVRKSVYSLDLKALGRRTALFEKKIKEKLLTIINCGSTLETGQHILEVTKSSSLTEHWMRAGMNTFMTIFALVRSCSVSIN